MSKNSHCLEVKSKSLSCGKFISVSPAGDVLLSNNEISTHQNNMAELIAKGFAYEKTGDFYHQSSKFRRHQRISAPKKLNYIIAVPTLRCDLSCSYCQVSRASESASGYDWSDIITNKFISFVIEKCEDNVKIEFQGGEPTLRLDIIQRVITEVSKAKAQASFVICTNLNNVTNDLLDLLEHENVYISSSMDGPPEIHTRNRTKNNKLTENFLNNLDYLLDRFGTRKISLLPTIADYTQIPKIIDFFFEKGLPEIFLRPVNFHGFAKKQFKSESNDYDTWVKSYLEALDYIENRNATSNTKMIETNLSIHLNRIFKPKSFDYVDLRNPNLMGADYFVVNYDGQIFPTDEARMLHRTNVIDLSIGNINSGLDANTLKSLNSKSSNFGDVACDKCVYQLFCGVDNIDKISRYGTLDYPTNDTFFCHNHIGIFDYIFSKLSNKNPLTINNFSFHLTGRYEASAIFSELFYD